jgi:hypothetical protein
VQNVGTRAGGICGDFCKGRRRRGRAAVVPEWRVNLFVCFFFWSFLAVPYRCNSSPVRFDPVFPALIAKGGTLRKKWKL